MLRSFRFLFCLFFLILFTAASFAAGTWTRQFTTSGANNQSLFFVSSLEGYVANGALWKTTQGGTTWESIPLGVATYLALGVSYINSTLYTAGTDIPANGLIRYTTNGGTTWTQIAPGDIGYYGIWFADQNNAVAVGGCWSGDFRHTTNGGTTWTAVNLGLGTTYKAHSTSTNNIWVCGDAGAAKFNGVSWSAVTVTGASTLRGIHAEDTNNIWACGDDGTNGCIFKTTNGGTSWTKVTLGTTATLTDLWFIDANEGWVVGNGGIIYHTSTGGGTTASWAQEYPSTTNNLLAVFFTDVNNGWATGTDGIYKYTDISPTTTTTTTTIIGTTTTTLYNNNAAGPGYSTGKQYWNPDRDGNLPVSFYSEVARQATLVLIQIGPPYSSFKRSIAVTAGYNKPTINATSDLGGTYANGIYKLFVFDNASNKVFARGLVTIYR